MYLFTIYLTNYFFYSSIIILESSIFTICYYSVTLIDLQLTIYNLKIALSSWVDETPVIVLAFVSCY